MRRKLSEQRQAKQEQNNNYVELREDISKK